MVTTIVNYIIKILIFIIDIILQFFMLLSLPLVWLIAEGNSVKFNQYIKIKGHFLVRFLSRIKYILWGLPSLSVVIYTLFVYNSIYIYTSKVFGFNITKSISVFIILVTIVVSLIYYTLVISLQREIFDRKLGDISFFTNFFRLAFIFLFVTILSYPYKLNEKNFILSKVVTGYNKINLILEFKVPKFHHEYIVFTIKNTILFSLVILIKIGLIYLDLLYLKNKNKEIIKVLPRRQI